MQVGQEYQILSPNNSQTLESSGLKLCVKIPLEVFMTSCPNRSSDLSALNPSADLSSSNQLVDLSSSYQSAVLVFPPTNQLICLLPTNQLICLPDQSADLSSPLPTNQLPVVTMMLNRSRLGLAIHQSLPVAWVSPGRDLGERTEKSGRPSGEGLGLGKVHKHMMNKHVSQPSFPRHPKGTNQCNLFHSLPPYCPHPHPNK